MLDKVLADPVEFISRLTIKNKSGKLVRFGDVMTPEQIELIKTLQRSKRVIVVKARQLGISTIVRAFAFWEAFTSRDPFNSAVVSNKEKSSFNLLDIDRRFFKYLPKNLKRSVSVDTKAQMQFASNGTNLLAMTVRADSQDRGWTLNTAHLSEFAFYDNAEVYLASLIASINEGRIIIESTPNYHGDALHELVKDSTYDKRWDIVFMPWSSFPSYRSDDLVDPNEDEIELMESYDLDIEQISWRRHKIAEMKSETLFRKEYPLTINDAWTLDEKSYLSSKDLQHIQSLPYSGGYEVFTPPSRGQTYAIGVDPAGGVGGDNSVATVINKLDNVIAAKICSNKKSINQFALEVIDLAKHYNNAMILFERNNQGHGFEQILMSQRYPYYQAWDTTMKSKITLLDQLKSWVQEGMIDYLDEMTLSEMRMLQNSDNGLAPKHPQGMHDDSVISYALAIECLKYVKVPEDPHSLLWKKIAAKAIAGERHITNPLQALRR